jgi:hypothetical protein
MATSPVAGIVGQKAHSSTVQEGADTVGAIGKLSNTRLFPPVLLAGTNRLEGPRRNLAVDRAAEPNAHIMVGELLYTVGERY